MNRGCFKRKPNETSKHKGTSLCANVFTVLCEKRCHPIKKETLKMKRKKMKTLKCCSAAG